MEKESKINDFVKKNFKVILASLLIVVGIGLLLLTEHSIRVHKNGDGVNQPKLPENLALSELNTSKTVSLDSFKGKVLLINFWATWCDACIVEMPGIIKLYEDFKAQGFEVISINVDETPDTVVPEMVKKLGMSFPIYIDKNGVLSQSFDVVAIPFSIIVDRSQNVVWTGSGERDWTSEDAIEEIKNLL